MSDQSNQAKIVAVVTRNRAGQLVRCDSAKVGPGDSATVVSVADGVVVVLGPFSDDDLPLLEALLLDVPE